MSGDRISGKLAVFALAMFGFGYALVPLYDVICDVTGLNGKTGEITAESVSELVVDHDRTVTVQFDTNVNSALPWKFKAVDKKLVVHPGEVTEAVFIAVNTSAAEVTGQAVPSVAPAQASLYFNKTECFCFSRQTLAGHEQKEMVVRFVVEADLPENISTLTLSYTFFVAPEPEDIARQAPVVLETTI
ncbi:MAG: cytochrome c oxidase assembly protein [Gammaproteobacteria bacterium]